MSNFLAVGYHLGLGAYDDDNFTGTWFYIWQMTNQSTFEHGIHYVYAGWPMIVELITAEYCTEPWFVPKYVKIHFINHS